MAKLNELPGYRSGFFQELFVELQDAVEDKKFRSQEPTRPRLVYAPDFRTVMIHFDLDATRRGVYKLENRKISKSQIECTGTRLTEVLCGERFSSEGVWREWSIPGWDPRTRPVALFHVERGFVSTAQQLVEGQYFCLASYDNPPPSDIQCSSVGMVELKIEEMDYDAWIVDVGRSTDLSWAGFSKDDPALWEEMICWENKRGLLEGAVGLESTFVGLLPPLEIHSLQDFANDIVALFIDDGLSMRRVLVGPNSTKILIDVPVPSRGRIWVEPISRKPEFAGRNILCELPYVVLPKCVIKWPYGLYSPSDTPAVSFESQSPNVLFQLDDAKSSDHKGIEWKIDPDVGVVEGRVICGEISIEVAKRIYRANIRKSHENKTSFFTREDFNSNTRLIISSVAGTGVGVSLFDGASHSGVLASGRFASSGEYRCVAIALRDSIESYRCPVGTFSLLYNGEYVKTNAVFLDTSQIVDWIESDRRDLNHPSWIEGLPIALGRVLDSLKATYGLPQTRTILNHCASLPDTLLSYARLVGICAAIFDDTAISDCPMSEGELVSQLHTDDPASAAGVWWYIQARKACESTTVADETVHELTDQFQKISWLPPFPRWASMMEKQYSLLMAKTNVAPLVKEWCEEVRGGYRSTYTSDISREANGRELTNAWISYNQGNTNVAISTAHRLVDCAASPVGDLALILIQICYFRSALFDSQPKLHFDSSNSQLIDAHSAFEDIVRSPTSVVNLDSNVTKKLYNLLAVLPLATRDAAVFRLLLTGKEAMQAGSVTDWLICYIRLCLAVEAKDPSDIAINAQALDRVRSEIPFSEDRTAVIELLENCL